jgi:hypothetical protein
LDGGPAIRNFFEFVPGTSRTIISLDAPPSQKERVKLFD